MKRFIFPEWTVTLNKAVGVLVLGAPVYLVMITYFWGVTPEAIRIGYQPEQPVPYSHALHVGELGMDCRYCHNSVEASASAAVPPAATCMNCHFGIRPQSLKLQPVREAFNGGDTLQWVRVHNLPDYVFFNHSAHVTRGIGCESCHGRIDLMEEVYQAEPLTMGWCLDCHREPEKHLRPVSAVTDMGYFEDVADQVAKGRELRESTNINPPLDCSTCHR